MSVVLLVLFVGLSACWRSVKYNKPEISAAHHGEKSFISQAQKSSPLWSYLKMRTKEGLIETASDDAVRLMAQPVDFNMIDQPTSSPQLTWLGHATVLVQYNGVNFITDPHLSEYASPMAYLGPKRLVPPALSVDQLPSIDFVLISHNHYDHLDHKTVLQIGNDSKWLVPLGLKQWLVKRDIAAENIIELDWWQSHKFSQGISITATPSQHWSKRTPFDTNKSLWASWHININGFKTWFAGDTGYNQAVFSQIGNELGPHDLALIPIGAYAPRYFMLPQHIDPQQALLTHQDIKSKFSLGIHWGTFQLTHEPFMEPKEELTHLTSQYKPLHPFVTLKIGQTQYLDLTK